MVQSFARSSLLLLLAILGQLNLCLCDDIEREFDYYKEDIERYLETLLTKATQSLSRQSSVDLPDTEKTFSKKIAFVNVHGGLQTFNGKLRGQNSLYKDGEVQATWAGDETINVEANLAFDRLEIETDARVWLGKLRKKFFMSAIVRHLKITVDMEFPLSSSGTPQVTSIVVRDMGKLSLDFKGLGPFNWLLEGLGYFLNTGIRKKVKTKIQGIMLNIINEEIGKIQLPTLNR